MNFLARQGSDTPVGPLSLAAIQAVGLYSLPPLIPLAMVSTPWMPLLIDARPLAYGAVDGCELPFFDGMLHDPLR